MRAALVAGLIVAASALTACGGGQTSAYCHEVGARQKHLSEIIDGGAKDALVSALPDFRALAQQAPDDIHPDWETVISAVATLQRAIRGGDQATIAAAATALRSSPVETALADVQQQVRDVCHTPLTL